MSIYKEPVFENRLGFATKNEIELIFNVVENHEPGFCKQHGIELDQELALSDGTRLFAPGTNLSYLRKKLQEVWSKIPAKSKAEFFRQQYADACRYLAQCLSAADCVEKKDFEQNRLLPFPTTQKEFLGQMKVFYQSKDLYLRSVK